MFKLLFSLALLKLLCIFEIQHHSLQPHQGRAVGCSAGWFCVLLNLLMGVVI